MRDKMIDFQGQTSPEVGIPHFTDEFLCHFEIIFSSMRWHWSLSI